MYFDTIGIIADDVRLTKHVAMAAAKGKTMIIYSALLYSMFSGNDVVLTI